MELTAVTFPAEVLPLLLSTMRLPEIEAEEAGLLSEHDSAVASRGLANYYEQLGVRRIMGNPKP